MPAIASDPLGMFTRRSGSYDRFIRLVRYPQALRAYFRHSRLLRPNLRILDAGCGTGALTLAVRDAIVSRGLTPYYSPENSAVSCADYRHQWTCVSAGAHLFCGTEAATSVACSTSC
jgi:hypothetical protein